MTLKHHAYVGLDLSRRDGKSTWVILIVGLLCVGLGGCPFSEQQKIDARISRPSLPAVPPYIANCFRGVVDFKAVDTSRGELLRIMAKIRASEAYKDKCGKRFEAWYESVRKSYGGAA